MTSFGLDDALKAAARATGASAALLFVARDGRVQSARGYQSSDAPHMEQPRAMRLAASAIAAGLPQQDAGLVAHAVEDLSVVFEGAREPHATALYPWLYSIAFALRAEAALERQQAAEIRAETLLMMDAATREVFVLMGRARDDVRPVLQLIVDSALRLCNARSAQLHLIPEGAKVGLIELRAMSFAEGVSQEAVAATYAAREAISMQEKVILSRKIFYSPDLGNDANVPSSVVEASHALGIRSLMIVPMSRDGRANGCLSVAGAEEHQFNERQIRLLQTFADQAAITVETEKLFGELESRNSDLEQANVHKNQFLANMSHELRTPLNAIIGISEMLLEDARELGSSDAQPLERVVRSGKHLLALINDVLDLAKIEAGKIELRLDLLDVQQLIDDVSVTAMPLARKNNNRFEVLQRGLLGQAQIDALRLRQVLINLVGNACKFTVNGSVILAVSRLTREGTEWLRFEVEDSGMGMTPEAVSRLFSEFTQVDALNTRKHGGTGLGLAISRRLCRAMGGDINVVSTEGKGTVFAVEVPISTQAQPEFSRSAQA